MKIGEPLLRGVPISFGSASPATEPHAGIPCSGPPSCSPQPVLCIVESSCELVLMFGRLPEESSKDAALWVVDLGSKEEEAL